MAMSVTIGFIGFGNMAQAMAKGLLVVDAIKPENVFASAKHYDTLSSNASALGINACESNDEVIAKSDIIVPAIIPSIAEDVLAPYRSALKEKTVVSIISGFDYDRLESVIGEGSHHISTIPNTPISVGEGILVCESRHSLTDAELAVFTAIFRKAALIEFVDAAQFSIAGTISGCTPAFTAVYLEALADAGVKYGLTRASAYRLAAKMLVGTGKLYLDNNMHPGCLKDSVCSPGGTTIRGIASLEKNAFRGAVIDAIDAIEG